MLFFTNGRLGPLAYVITIAIAIVVVGVFALLFSFLISWLGLIPTVIAMGFYLLLSAIHAFQNN